LNHFSVGVKGQKLGPTFNKTAVFGIKYCYNNIFPIFIPRSEQLLVTVNAYTGAYIVHVPQVDPSPPAVTEIEEMLNSSHQDVNKIKALVSQLRYARFD